LRPGRYFFTLKRSYEQAACLPSGDGYAKGKEALLDALVLARGSYLFRTASNLSAAALLFNPELHFVLLNQALYWGDQSS